MTNYSKLLQLLVTTHYSRHDPLCSSLTGMMRDLSQHQLELIKAFLLDPIRCPTSWPTLLAHRG